MNERPRDSTTHLNEDDELVALRAENTRLREELAKYENGLTRAQSATTWLTRTWLGSDVNAATRDLSTAAQAWQSGTAPAPLRETLDFLGSVAARLTRIGVFRVTVAVLVAVATLWFSVAQVMLLRKQNEIIDAQKRAHALELYFRFSDQYAEVFRAWSQAGELSVKHSGALLYANNSHPLMMRKFRERLAAIGDTSAIAGTITATCGVGLAAKPFGTAMNAARMVDEGKQADAAHELDQANLWWRATADDCKRRQSELFEETERLKVEMRPTLDGVAR
jgi:hypothetical protein